MTEITPSPIKTEFEILAENICCDIENVVEMHKYLNGRFVQFTVTPKIKTEYSAELEFNDKFMNATWTPKQIMISGDSAGNVIIPLDGARQFSVGIQANLDAFTILLNKKHYKLSLLEMAIFLFLFLDSNSAFSINIDAIIP
jgi:hypothetical protein